MYGTHSRGDDDRLSPEVQHFVPGSVVTTAHDRVVLQNLINLRQVGLRQLDIARDDVL